MSGRERRAERLFRAVTLCFSALLLVLSLLTAVRTTAVNDRAAALEKEIAALETERELLRVRCESGVDLAALEDYALRELGMQPCRSGQIVYIGTD